MCLQRNKTAEEGDEVFVWTSKAVGTGRGQDLTVPEVVLAEEHNHLVTTQARFLFHCCIYVHIYIYITDGFADTLTCNVEPQK